MIRTRLEYDNSLRKLAELVGPFQTSNHSDEIERIAGELENYERDHHISFPSPEAAIRYRMKQLGLSIDQMGPYLGSPSQARQVLNGTAPLTIKMIQSMIGTFGLSADALIQPVRKAA